MKPDSYNCLVNGKWISSSDGKTFEDFNPADSRDIVGIFPDLAVQDVSAAVDAAAKALPGWRALGMAKRAQVLEKAAQVLEKRLEEVAQALTREEGKTLMESRGETARAVAILKFYAAEGSRPLGEVIPSANPKTLLYTTRVPLGVVSLITPWNFPVAIPMWKMAPALIFGNTVVLKPASLAPLTSILLGKVMEEAGVPPGVVNVVTTRRRDAGEVLVKHPEIKALSFTGSAETGRHLAKIACENGKKYQLEMGGKNPVIVAEDADLDQAAELTVSGTMRSAGEKCTATSRAIVVGRAHREFTGKVVTRVKALKLGPGTDPDSYLGPVISEEARQSILSLIEAGKKEGAKLLAGGSIPKGGQFAHGFYVEPTVFDEVSPKARIAREEIFGPVLAIIPAGTLAEAIAIANDVEYGLSASLFTKDLNSVLDYAEQIEAGLVRVNGETAGVEPHAPFGGMKGSSSYSREQGRAAMEFYTQIKTVYVDRAGK